MSCSTCPFCGREGEDALAGLTCSSCLEGYVRQDAARVFVSDYELHDEELGEGGTGVVYRAEHRLSHEIVAIKLAKEELLAERDGARLFLRQARTESRLRHPHIVGVVVSGVHDGRPFLVMPYMERGTLARRANLERLATFEDRIDVMMKITKAVQFAHERGVLHCDLKPENVLFDGAHEPHVSDFGMARSIDEAATASFEGGSPPYMSPEQVRREPLTTKSDVFALGAVLYELTTGRPAFPADDRFEPAVLAGAQPPLPAWRPGHQWGLLAIAHRAMQHDPEKRYPTAAALLEDLERLRTHQVVRGHAVPRVARWWSWAERHPGVHIALAALLLCFAVLALVGAHAQRDELRRGALDMNAYAASGQAAAVLYQFRDYAAAVEQAAEDERVKALVLVPLGSNAGPGAPPCGDRTQLSDPAPLRPYAATFSTIAVFDVNGCARARVAEEPPPPLAFLTNRYDWRDYFVGAREDGQQGLRRSWVRPAYRSTVSQMIKFAVSSPLFVDEVGAPSGRRWIGVVAGSMTVASTLQLPRQRRADGDRLTVVVGPFEGEGTRGAVPRAPEFTFLAHPDLRRGDKVVLAADLSAELHRAFNAHTGVRGHLELTTALPLVRADYRDPFKGDRWLAAFAPVGATGHVVLVQSRDAAAIAPTLFVSRLGYGLLLLAAALVAGFGGVALWSEIVRRRTIRELFARLPPG